MTPILSLSGLARQETLEIHESMMIKIEQFCITAPHVCIIYMVYVL